MVKYDDILLVGLTGGIGCGQSTVAGFLKITGCKIIDADRVARQVVQNDRQVRKELRREFGSGIFYRDGTLNRKLLAQIAFRDEKKTQRLNRIVHPRMVSEIIDEIETARDSKKYSVVVVDAALIYEVDLEKLFDVVIVVTAKLGDRIKRVMERDGISEKEIKARISKQIPVHEKARWADITIHNTTTLQQLEFKTKQVYSKLMNIYKKKQRSAVT